MTQCPICKSAHNHECRTRRLLALYNSKARCQYTLGEASRVWALLKGRLPREALGLLGTEASHAQMGENHGAALGLLCDRIADWVEGRVPHWNPWAYQTKTAEQAAVQYDEIRTERRKSA